MGDRYIYDKHGNYKGKSSDRPPGFDYGGAICGLIIILFILGQCGSSPRPINAEQGGDGQALSRCDSVDLRNPKPYPPSEAALRDRAAMP
jgi:hypothetical protein